MTALLKNLLIDNIKNINNSFLIINNIYPNSSCYEENIIFTMLKYYFSITTLHIKKFILIYDKERRNIFLYGYEKISLFMKININGLSFTMTHIKYPKTDVSFVLIDFIKNKKKSGKFLLRNNNGIIDSKIEFSTQKDIDQTKIIDFQKLFFYQCTKIIKKKLSEVIDTKNNYLKHKYSWLLFKIYYLTCIQNKNINHDNDEISINYDLDEFLGLNIISEDEYTNNYQYIHNKYPYICEMPYICDILQIYFICKKDLNDNNDEIEINFNKVENIFNNLVENIEDEIIFSKLQNFFYKNIYYVIFCEKQKKQYSNKEIIFLESCYNIVMKNIKTSYNTINVILQHELIKIDYFVSQSIITDRKYSKNYFDVYIITNNLT